MATVTVTFTITEVCLRTGVSEEERLRNELELDWPGIAVALTLLDENARLTRENRLLQQRLARFLAHG